MGRDPGGATVIGHQESRHVATLRRIMSAIVSASPKWAWGGSPGPASWSRSNRMSSPSVGLGEPRCPDDGGA
jgi:hypothetical protein